MKLLYEASAETQRCAVMDSEDMESGEDPSSVEADPRAKSRARVGANKARSEGLLREERNSSDQEGSRSVLSELAASNPGVVASLLGRVRYPVPGDSRKRAREDSRSDSD